MDFVGLDVSLKPTAICIVDRTGKIVREGVVTSDPVTILIHSGPRSGANFRLWRTHVENLPRVIRCLPCKCHADYFILHGTFYSTQDRPINIGLLARPKRFELLTPKFVIWCSIPAGLRQL